MLIGSCVVGTDVDVLLTRNCCKLLEYYSVRRYALSLIIPYMRAGNEAMYMQVCMACHSA